MWLEIVHPLQVATALPKQWTYRPVQKALERPMLNDSTIKKNAVIFLPSVHGYSILFVFQLSNYMPKLITDGWNLSYQIFLHSHVHCFRLRSFFWTSFSLLRIASNILSASCSAFGSSSEFAGASDLLRLFLLLLLLIFFWFAADPVSVLRWFCFLLMLSSDPVFCCCTNFARAICKL